MPCDWRTMFVFKTHPDFFGEQMHVRIVPTKRKSFGTLTMGNFPYNYCITKHFSCCYPLFTVEFISHFADTLCNAVLGQQLQRSF